MYKITYKKVWDQIRFNSNNGYHPQIKFEYLSDKHLYYTHSILVLVYFYS